MPLLSEATSIKVGSSSATAAYMGTTLVWPLSTGITVSYSTIPGSGNSSIMISGAGITDVNGLYEIGSSPVNDAPFWGNTQTGYQIFLPAPVSAAWVIEDGGPDGLTQVYETFQKDLASPLDGNWVVTSGGEPPIPILGTAYNVTVSGSSFSAINGTYSYSNTLYGYPVYVNGFRSIFKDVDTGGGKWRIQDVENGTIFYETTQTNLINPWEGTWVSV